MLDWWEGRGRGDPLGIALYRSSDSDEDEEDKVEDEDGVGEPRGEITSSPKRLLRLGGGRECQDQSSAQHWGVATKF